jgi:hypothetical protein
VSERWPFEYQTKSGLWLVTELFVKSLDYKSFVRLSWNVLKQVSFISATPQMQKPQLLDPDFAIAGGPSIKQYHVLNDKRHILVSKIQYFVHERLNTGFWMSVFGSSLSSIILNCPW